VRSAERSPLKPKTFSNYGRKFARIYYILGWTENARIDNEDAWVENAAAEIWEDCGTPNERFLPCDCM